MKGYTSRTEIENYLLTDIDVSFHAQTDRWIEDIEAYIENITGRVFIADSTATARKYDGDNTSVLLIDDCVEVVEVFTGDDDDPLSYGESGVDDDFLVYPANILPKTRLKRVDGSWGRGNQNIEVSAKWGYSVAAPFDIRHAATVLVAGIINFGNQAEGEIQSMSIGRYNVTYKDNKQWEDFEKLKDVFNHYKKYML